MANRTPYQILSVQVLNKDWASGSDECLISDLARRFLGTFSPQGQIAACRAPQLSLDSDVYFIVQMSDLRPEL